MVTYTLCDESAATLIVLIDIDLILSEWVELVNYKMKKVADMLTGSDIIPSQPSLECICDGLLDHMEFKFPILFGNRDANLPVEDMSVGGPEVCHLFRSLRIVVHPVKLSGHPDVPNHSTPPYTQV